MISINTEVENVFLDYIRRGYYKVMSDGVIVQLATWKMVNKQVTWVKLKKPKIATRKSGNYLSVGVPLKGKTKTVSAHRIVYRALIGDIPEGYVVNHKNGNGWHNNPANLEAVTPSENTVHAKDVLKRGPWPDKDTADELILS